MDQGAVEPTAMEAPKEATVIEEVEEIGRNIAGRPRGVYRRSAGT
jgi:hypothetical protein